MSLPPFPHTPTTLPTIWSSLFPSMTLTSPRVFQGWCCCVFLPPSLCLSTDRWYFWAGLAAVFVVGIMTPGVLMAVIGGEGLNLRLTCTPPVSHAILTGLTPPAAGVIPLSCQSCHYRNQNHPYCPYYCGKKLRAPAGHTVYYLSWTSGNLHLNFEYR